jgi:hypothetical protein
MQKRTESGREVPHRSRDLARSRAIRSSEAETAPNSGQEQEDCGSPQDNQVEAELRYRIVVDESQRRLCWR